MFIPHEHMCMNDHYSIMNYRSDSALTFANYILSNNLLLDKVIIVGVFPSDDISVIQKYLRDHFPKRKVVLANLFGWRKEQNAFRRYLNRKELFKMIANSSHVFTSQTPLFRPIAKSNRIKFINLGYYVAPIKDSTHDKNNRIYIDYQSITEKDYDYYIVSSEVSKRLIMATYSIGYNHYKVLGMCRNDYLFSDDFPQTLREDIINSVSYPVKKIVLYTPTHRDNLAELTQFNATQNLFGFSSDLVSLNEFFKEQGLLLICKVHPKQHHLIKQNELPESIVLFEANNCYGLAELMKVSDALITDYTSGYFDYLILDKPVLFNFTDISEYGATRGLIFNPIYPICAGDVVRNEAELKVALANLESNRDIYSEKRKDVLEMFHFYRDSNTCERVYNYFFAG